jgi:hypothetical protein
VKDETARPQSDMDVLKFYIWLMVVMTLALGGFFWHVWSKLDSTRSNLQQGVNSVKEFEIQQAEIQGMLNVYKNNKEDVARDSPMTWFSNIWNRCGINANSLTPTTWKAPPRFDAKGKFYEEQFDIAVNAKTPLTRELVAKFCHEIEKSSTRLRILELTVGRADKDGLEKDDWQGKISIGYRHARLD